MTITNLQKAEADRETYKDQIEFLETELTRHTTTPLVEIEVDNYIIEVSEVQKLLAPNQNSIRLYSTKGADMGPHVTEFRRLNKLAARVHAGFHGIKSSFPPSTVPTHSVSVPTTSHGIKLPPLELPRFSGNLQEWVTFRDMFTNAVHNSSLTKIEKLTQLKSLLTGEASRQVRSLILSDANYDIAWDTLIQRYENNRELLFSIIRRLLTQQPLTNGTATALRSLVDTTRECVRSLETLAIRTHQWDAIICYVIFSKLDSASRELWEQSLPNTNIPNLDQLYEFVEQRARAVAASSITSAPKQQQRPQQQARAHHVTHSPCKIGCTTAHPLFKCEEFRKQSPKQRNDSIRQLKLCINCLNDGHMSSSCPNKYNCKVCNRRHHTLLHLEVEKDKQGPPPQIMSHHTAPDVSITTGVLATARIRVESIRNDNIVRALIDGGSTNTHITKAAASRLKLPLRPCFVPMAGLGNAPVGAATHVTSFTFSSYFDENVKFTVTALVVEAISGNIPNVPLVRHQWHHLKNLNGPLADPNYHKSDLVDVLLGTDIVWNTLESGKIYGKPGQPIGIKTSLGWLIAGANQSTGSVATMNTQINLDALLLRFWEQETINDNSNNPLTKEEQACELHFKTTHSRDQYGRFTVSLPFKTPTPILGRSRQHAEQRLLSLENKYVHQRNVIDARKKKYLTKTWTEYQAFMTEYERLGHMEPVPHVDPSCQTQVFYIPHHCVVKESSTTTKLRVVFDASAKTTNGTSLNDHMMVGPQLQDNIWDIMLRFRLHPIAFTADVKMMYRQIWVSDEHQDFQRILWRTDPTLPIQEYRLKTVTYGTSSAPYLAVKCLQQLASDEQHRYPDAALIAKRNFYVDDTASSCETLDGAKQVVSQLLDLCKSGGMELRKWTSNSQALLDCIPVDLRETTAQVELTDGSVIKTLGVFWSPSDDIYTFKINLSPEIRGKYTKRIILSEIAKIYDPLGWLSPTIILCKIFMQDLWKGSYSWDNILPTNIQYQWLDIRGSLKELENIKIPRCVIPRSSKRLFLVGCSDASSKALSAAIYLIAEYHAGPQTCHLMTSKTKVAPLKLVTIARLELNAAVLLSELLQSTLKTLPLEFEEVRAFTDSTITYHWVTSDASRWKPYVRRRVQSVQENAPVAKWFHISGDQNPADCASRGIIAADLHHHPQWWNGVPNFYSIGHQPTELLADQLEEINCETQVKVHKVQVMVLHPIFEKFSSFPKLQRVISYIFRFINNWCRRGTFIPVREGALTTHELLTAHNFIIRQVQLCSFSTEIKCISEGVSLPNNNALLRLQPIILRDKLLRVGGRLRHARIPLDQRHPILLPKGHFITNLLIQQYHVWNLHAGASSTLAALQQRYWITNGRDSVRFVIRRCVICTRHRADLACQIMADLPSPRITPSRPFSQVGVDYAGPLTIRPMVRSKISLKCWLAVYVCLATRAIHIEIVSSLSTDHFMASLRRFMSRRGKPSDIFSDCGTNFRGAEKVIRDFLVASQPVLQENCASEMINWHFNPPGAPHFGGLWEAGVRSIKHHLLRVMGNSTFTYEEMLTLVNQIEGILNSRPLVPASSEPSDLRALTPAHFLIGAPITGLPEPNLVELKQNHLQRWQLLQQQQQLFWKRWSNEYLTRLQQRPKWMKPTGDLSVGQLVIIKDERLPPLKWRLGRVTEIHPGADGHVRVVTLKTSDGHLKRPVVKLCLLPIESL